MSTLLPPYLQDFTCYLLRVQFAAQKEVEIKGPWTHLPSYALGDALMNSEKYSGLYDTLFKPKQGKFKNIPSRMIIRADGVRRFKFLPKEILNIYVTIVSNNRQEVDDFIHFLQEWSRFHFFKAHSFRFHSAYVLSPLSNEFEPAGQSDLLPLHHAFFNAHLIRWKHALEIRFLTPTSYSKDQLLTEEVSYTELIKRIRNRVYNLYYSFLAPDDNIEENIHVQTEADKATTLLNAISFPVQMILKNNKYNLSGLKGYICYAADYDYEEDFLLTLAHYIHVGNNTIRGNGQIAGLAREHDFFQKFLDQAAREGIDREVREQIQNHAYIPQPYRSVKIPKSDGDYRELEIPAEEDILLQKIMATILYPAIDRKLSYQNFAYRKGKGTLAAVHQVRKWISSFADTHFVIRCDVDNFFDSIPIDAMLKKLYATVPDAAVCHLIDLWIQSGKVNRLNEYEENTTGVPQGSAVSPLLANLYLSEFDRVIEQKITPHFIRYADDILLLVPKEEKIIRILQMLTDYLEANFKLKLNQEFYAGSLKDGFDFLGITFGCDGRLSISNDKKNRIDDKIKRALWLSAKENDFSELEKTVQGLKNYYGKLLSAEDKTAIDDIIVEVYRTYLQRKNSSAAIADTALQLSKVGFVTAKYADLRWWKQVKPAKQKRMQKPQNAEESLKIQKRRHLQEQAEVCELVVTLPGCFIGISKNKIQVKSEGKIIASKPINYIRQISILSEGVSLSSYVTKHCAKRNIQISYYDSHGEVYASVHSPAGILPVNMQAQLNLSDEQKKRFIIELVRNKIQNQQKLLKYYTKYLRKKNPQQSDSLHACIEEMEAKMADLPQEVSYESLREKVFLWEAQCALIYWRGIRTLLADTRYPFEQREHQHASSIVNQMLNYGYALLESKVTRAIHTWRISPQISYLHAMNGSTPTLCFDLMEQYRTFVVDRSVIAIITKGEKMEQEKNSNLLTLETRKKLIGKINERWFAVETYKGKEMLLSELMHKLMEHFLAYCKGEEKKPRFYKPKW